MEEVWKDIDGYEGLYQVSNMGKVRSLKRNNTNGKILRKCINKRGYEVVYFSKGNKKYAQRVHRLVAIAFIPEAKNKPQVNHIDGNKLNNCMNNLEWCTQSENIKHAYDNNLYANQRNIAKRTMAQHSTAKPVNQLDLNGKFIKRWGCIKEAGIFLGREKPTSIVSCCKGRKNTAYGFKWEYAQ